VLLTEVSGQSMFLMCEIRFIRYNVLYAYVLFLAVSRSYQYFVDLGILLDVEQPTYVLQETLKPGVTSHQKTSKDTVFPKSTKYRYSDVQKF